MAYYDLEALSLGELTKIQEDVAKAISTFEDRQKAEARAKVEAFAQPSERERRSHLTRAPQRWGRRAICRRSCEEQCQAWCKRKRRFAYRCNCAANILESCSDGFETRTEPPPLHREG